MHEKILYIWFRFGRFCMLWLLPWDLTSVCSIPLYRPYTPCPKFVSGSSRAVTSFMCFISLGGFHTKRERHRHRALRFSYLVSIQCLHPGVLESIPLIRHTLLEICLYKLFVMCWAFLVLIYCLVLHFFCYPFILYIFLLKLCVKSFRNANFLRFLHAYVDECQ